MMLFRYWAHHGASGSIQKLPAGEVNIESRGGDEVRIGGKKILLRRYVARGIVWGREWIWTDAAGKVIAIVTVCPWLDHIQAVREGYEAALPIVVHSALRDGLSDLIELKRQLTGAYSRRLAIVGGTLIDGTGTPPLMDATVILESGRIVAAGPSSQIRIPQGFQIIDAHGKTVLPESTFENTNLMGCNICHDQHS